PLSRNDLNIKAFAVDIDGTLTENGNGMIYLPAVSKMRFLEKIGYRVFFVTGRSSVEAYVLSVFLGITRVAVGENGGVVSKGPSEHTILGNKDLCLKGYEILKQSLSVDVKPVFPRLSEVVLQRTFDIEEGKNILKEKGMKLDIVDSKYAFHINELGVNKARGLNLALEFLNIEPKEVVAIGDSETDIPVFRNCGLSIALGHSDDEVKINANHVVDGKEGVGLCDAIDYVSLKYLR
ncbi:MAG TPA: phosphoglycolate phosphatase, partial [Nitrososphaeraceae archaeon]|nr:phosphoglycolate phosphatase [Nitrososphaeraceae archaeon]